MKRSRKVESKDHAKYLALIQEFNHLEKTWKSLQKSLTSEPDNHSTTTISHHHHLFQTSPRTLMSSLQQRKPKNCSEAVEEILMDRRAAITSGRFKGRQLFGDWMDEREVIELPFPEEEEKTVVEVVAEKSGGGGDVRRKREREGGCFVLAMACLGILLFVVFFFMSCNANSVEEFILVPT